MRFWITKNSELPVREQLVRQVLLGILSEDLPSGHKLPSVRAVARRQNYEPEEVLHRLEHMLHPVPYERILIAEAEPAMREILHAELAESLTVPIDAADLNSPAVAPSRRSLVVALPTRAAKIRRQLPRGVPCIALRLRSVRASLEGQTKPSPDSVITVVSCSAEIRLGSRAMLISVGLDPDSLSEIDASSDGWQNRVARNALVVADVIVSRELPSGSERRVFRVVADSSLTELKQFCGL